MISFDEYLKQKKVLKREPDEALKNSLIDDSKERILQVELEGLKTRFKFEQAYESVRELADALLARDGFKTYSHEAALSYLKKLDIVSAAELERLDSCRTKRHDSKYYGEDIPEEECRELTRFLKDIFQKLKQKLEEAKT
jgi:uncharacterized protein (UPF0332 family)